MQHLTSTLGRLAVVLAGALALGSCSRSEYAFQSHAPSYLGTTTAAPKTRVATAPAPVASPAPEVATKVPAPATEAAVQAPQAPVAASPAKPQAAKVEAVASSVDAPVVAATPSAAASQKISLMQRLALAKVTKKLNKLAAKTPQLKRGDATASTARLDGNLRYAIIFGVISLIFFAIGGTLLNIIGTVLLIIGLLFLLFWVLDAL